jgi:hypothetical protein
MPIDAFRLTRGDDGNGGAVAVLSTETLVWVAWLSSVLWLSLAKPAS